MAIFNFVLPIGWDELSAFSTTAAVIVAIISNHRATKQMRLALQMQEQSKNVQLADARIAIIDKLRAKEAISETTLQILFNQHILAEYQQWKAFLSLLQGAESDKKLYFQLCREKDERGNYTNPTQSKIEEFEIYLAKPDCPDTVYTIYQQYCNDKAIEYSPTGFSEDRRSYNYNEISNRISEVSHQLNIIENKLYSDMEQFVTDSIKELKF